MDWVIWGGIAVVVLGWGTVLYFIISEIVWGVREDNWLERMDELDRANYVEGILDKSSALSSLFSLAKGLGIAFKLHPDSFQWSKKKGYIWDANHITKKIRVSVDPKTVQVVPVDLWDQRFVMAHEIGHIISPSTNFEPPCCRNKDFIIRCILEDGHTSCLFRELGAEIEGKKVLEQVFTANGDLLDISSAIEAKHRERIGRLKKRCSICWGEIAKGRCPKKEELCSFFQEK